jgi:hypothetical protein
VTSLALWQLCWHSFVLFLYLTGLYIYIKLDNISNTLNIN